MMLDRQADISRQAWLPCPHCSNNTGLYLLYSEANMVWVQCGKCLRRWWHDTGCGRGGRVERLFDVA
ncbi:MAG TPA: hypothetical protein VFQ77_11840 [Pseudonocardiaceae bacterium]|jgi:hypothetical protein|nr:hypothetical protein [Pseudonocardiaceae bacterium]